MAVTPVALPAVPPSRIVPSNVALVLAPPTLQVRTRPAVGPPPRKLDDEPVISPAETVTPPAAKFSTMLRLTPAPRLILAVPKPLLVFRRTSPPFAPDVMLI